MYEAEFAWPGGAHIAVVLNVSWEIWPKTLATAENNQRPGETVPPDAPYAAHGTVRTYHRLTCSPRRL